MVVIGLERRRVDGLHALLDPAHEAGALVRGEVETTRLLKVLENLVEVLFVGLAHAIVGGAAVGYISDTAAEFHSRFHLSDSRRRRMCSCS